MSSIFKGDSGVAFPFTDNVGFDLTGADTIQLHLSGPVERTVDGAFGGDPTVGDVQVVFSADDTATAGVYATLWTFAWSGNGTVRSAPGEGLVILDPLKMWGRLVDVQQMVGDVDRNLALESLVTAEQLVRTWCNRTIPTPPPARVRYAVATLAARNLDGVKFRSADGMPLLEEKIDEVSYRYQAPDRASWALTKDIAQLLSPWIRKAGSAYVGPPEDGLEVPISPTGVNLVETTATSAGGVGAAGSATAP